MCHLHSGAFCSSSLNFPISSCIELNDLPLNVIIKNPMIQTGAFRKNETVWPRPHRLLAETIGIILTILGYLWIRRRVLLQLENKEKEWKSFDHLRGKALCRLILE